MKNAEKMTDRLSAGKIGTALSEAGFSVNVTVYDTIDSTNTEAKRICNSCRITENLLICAENQTAGRGRSGHSFYSPDSTGLYMTLVLSPKASTSDVIPLTTMAAAAVYEALSAVSDADYRIKWVNDIYAVTDTSMKKVCGILTELVTDPIDLSVRNVIIGIGINITTENFPEDITHIAASTGKLRTDRSALAADIAGRLIKMSHNLNDRSYMNIYRERSFVIGRTVKFIKDGEQSEAKAVGITDDAALIVEYQNGEREYLNGGEISVKPI